MPSSVYHMLHKTMMSASFENQGKPGISKYHNINLLTLFLNSNGAKYHYAKLLRTLIKTLKTTVNLTV